jgi:hypothetical protein
VTDLFADDPQATASFDAARRDALARAWTDRRNRMPAQCRADACRARIDWLITPDGKWMPIDPDPHPRGTVAVEAHGIARIAHVIGDGEYRAAILRLLRGEQDPPRYMPHWVSCQAADDFRPPR